MFIKKIILSIGLLIMHGGIANALTCESKTSGNWNASATWNNCGSSIPSLLDIVIIKNTHVVSLDVDTAELGGLTVDIGGDLNVAQRLVNPELGYSINLHQSATQKVDLSNTLINLSAHLTINAKGQDILLGGVIGPFDINLNSSAETWLMGQVGDNSTNSPTTFITDSLGETVFSFNNNFSLDPSFIVYGSVIFNDDILLAEYTVLGGEVPQMVFKRTVNSDASGGFNELSFNFDDAPGVADSSIQFNGNVGEVKAIDQMQNFSGGLQSIEMKAAKFYVETFVTLPHIYLNSPTLDVFMQAGVFFLEGIIRTSAGANPNKLTIQSTISTVNLGGGVGGNSQPLSSLVVNSASSISLSSVITTTEQNYTGTVKLNSNATMTSSKVIFHNDIDTRGYNLGFNTTDTSAATKITGVVSGTGGLIKNGVGSLNFYSINTFTGNVMLNEGQLVNKINSNNIFPNVPQLSLASGAIALLANPVSGNYTLGNNQSIVGNGLFTGRLVANSGAIVSPGINAGASPGTLTVGKISMAAGSTLSIEINGTTSNLEYDRLTLDQGGSVAGATLDLNFGYVPSVGDSFKIIRSLGTLTGTFSGYPDGYQYFVGDKVYSISYVAGDGNDMVLSVGSSFVHVDADAAAGGDGESWATAFNNLQDALAVAIPGMEIWVAQGTYYPDEGGGQSNNDRLASFTLLDGIPVYGGFNGTETQLNQRDPEVNITILSGDLEQNDGNSDGNNILEDIFDVNGSNSYHIINGAGVNTSTIFSGFIVTAGQANISNDTNGVGAGMYCGFGFNGPSISMSTFIGNYAAHDGAATYGCSQDVKDSGFINNYSRHGGAIYIRGGLYESVLFQGNTATGAGGAIAKNASPLKIVNSQFLANQASGNGGAISSVNGVTLENVLFSGNKSSSSGGAINQNGSSSNLTNVTMTGNLAAGLGGAININNATLNLRNSIIWNNHDNTTDTTASSSINSSSSTYTQTNSLVQNLGTGGVGNLDDDPLFITNTDPSTAPTALGNARLQFLSMAIDAGDNGFVTSGSMDLDNTDRIFNSIVDMGAYESSTTNTVSVNVTGLSAGTLILQNKGADDLTITNNGTQTFSTPVTQTDDYLVTVLSQPTSPDQECVVANPAGTINGSDVIVNVNCTTFYNVGVDVSGLANGVTLSVVNNSEPLNVTSNNPTNFATAIIDGGAYDVSVVINPSSPNQDCLITSSNAIGNINGIDVVVAIECTTLQYNVSVDVFGLAEGVTLSVMNNAETLNITSNGTINFPTALDDASAYAVLITSNPSSPNQECLVTSNNASGHIAGVGIEVTIQCTTNQYFVGGMASGLANGNSVTLSLAAEDLNIDSNAAFVFLNPLTDESDYSVSVSSQPTTPNQTCDIVNPTGTIDGNDISDIEVNCITNQYMVGGFVTGLHSGNNLVVQNNTSDDLTITASGDFDFVTPIDDLQSYNVSILNQPSNPIQLCSLNSNTGDVAGADVTTVSIVCEFGDDLIYINGFE